MASRGLSPRPRLLSLARHGLSIHPDLRPIAALGKISRIGWKRWLSSSYLRGFVPLISSLNRIASYTIYRIFINLIARGIWSLVSRKFFLGGGCRNYSRKRENNFFCSSFILDF